MQHSRIDIAQRYTKINKKWKWKSRQHQQAEIREKLQNVNAPSEAPNKRHKLIQIRSPNPADSSADERHPEPEEVLQPLHTSIGFTAPSEESVLKDPDCGEEL